MSSPLSGSPSPLIAISSLGRCLDDQLDPVLGRAALFLLIQSSDESYSVLDNSAAERSAQGAGLHTAETLIKRGVGVVISGDCGPKALEVLKSAGVHVLRAPGGTVRQALSAWREGTLDRLA